LPYPPLRYSQSGSTATSPARFWQPTAITPLTSCLTPGVHFTSAAGPCGGNATPTGVWDDFQHYSKSPLSGTIKKGQDWTDYKTNSQKEAQSATGVPDPLCYRAEMKEGEFPKGKCDDRRFSSIVHGITITVQHCSSSADVPETNYRTVKLDADK